VSVGSCKKEKDKTTDPAFDAQFNEASVEENKATLEDNGIQLVNNIDQMKDMDAVKILINLVGRIDGSETFSAENSVTAFITPAFVAKNTMKDGAKISDVANQLKIAAEDPENLLDLWNESVGIYDYDTIAGDFVKTEGGDEIIVNFPGLEGDQTNTAQIKVNNFSYMTITEPFYDEDSGDDMIGQQLPTSLHFELSYESVILSTWDISAAYEANGLPTSFNSFFSINPYSLSVELIHDPYTHAEFTFSFKHNDEILIETHAAGNGDWSESNINENTQTETESDEWGEYTYTTVYVENIIQNANAYIQVLNIKIAGMVDFHALGPIIRDLDNQAEEPDANQQQLVNELVDAINDHAELVVVIADANEMIARAEAFAYYDDEWDEWSPELRFVFGDGSRVDAETYFETGFSDLVSQINNMIDEFNEEYDTNIEPIEY
jgi:hypothetical protein